MDYRKYAETYYVRMDKGDEIIRCILALCRKENIASAVFSGIGGCSGAEIQTLTDAAGNYYHHTHAVFSYKDGSRHCMAAGHIRSITVMYTAEIELRPVIGGAIKRKYDAETGTGFWDFA